MLFRSKATSIIKSKSLTGDEIGLQDALKKINAEWTETDLGQFILQLANEKPSHMVMPALHKSAIEVMQLFRQSGIPAETASPEELASRGAAFLRKKHLNPDIGITGANFLLADQGAVAITENEGNVMLAASRPRIHIVLEIGRAHV